MKKLLLVVTLLVAACAGGVGTEIHRDESTDMAGMKSFHIIRDSAVHGGPGSQEASSARREIERAIRDTLVEKGYLYAADDQAADFDVEYIAYTTERYQEGAHDRYLFGDRLHVVSGAESMLDNPVREGTLHIHLLKDGKPFYESIASGVVESQIPVYTRIRNTVPRMLDDVPLSAQ